LDAFAIDDRDNNDPDDAITLESFQVDGEGHFLGGGIWIHIADVAAQITPGCAADIEARARGATVYLPEGAVPMLPQSAVQDLGLGLNPISPALSIRLGLNAAAEIIDVEVVPSEVKVQRLSYDAAEERLAEAPFDDLHRLAQAYKSRRESNGALFIDLPEAIIQVSEGKVSIRRLLRLSSRNLVREAMLMAGEAAAIYAIENGIPFPFVNQEPADMSVLSEGPHPPDLSEDSEDGGGNLTSYYALRRTLKRSRVSTEPAPHSGIGLHAYSRTTSPLRRYLDLVAHQQLRAHLQGEGLLGDYELLERIGASESVTDSINQAEALARRHWTLVYLLQNPDWCGEGVLVHKYGGRGRVIIPDLALEAPVHLRGEFELNSVLNLSLQGVNLPELEVFFEIA
jgi:exoribonuclease-2